MSHQAAAPGTPEAPPAAPAAPAAPPQPQTTVDLSTIPDELLFKDPRFNTMVGRHAQRLAEKRAAEIQAEAEAKAIREQEQAMTQLAQSNPFEFAQKWLGSKAEEVAKREFSELETKTQRKILDAIGQAYGSVPEWKELTQDEFADVAARTAGLSGEQLIAAFNMAALDKVADKRANKRMESVMTERIRKEREAWEREAAAARLRGETSPDMSEARTMTGRFDPTKLSDKEFQEWYEANMLR